MPETTSSLEQEIIQLEKQLSEKKSALSKEKPLDTIQSEETEPSDKELLHSVIGEKIKQQAPQYQFISPSGGLAPVKPQSDDASQSYILPELKDKVQELINLVFNKSLSEGIKEASKSNNPALIDTFHDVLVDELYNVLLERKKLESVN